ncbi:hypothetical protein [Lentibacillus juripiscarius]|uniref:Uncharacterized protein n=1 Tax=Lentibacillus juripiscarius TaxID=257446 RepID=A0ABW5V5B7_9BACI
MNVNMQPIGETRVKVTFPGDVSPSLNRTIGQFCRHLREAGNILAQIGIILPK